ncbi:hypothetical protein U703_06045 [Rhodobacter capsulatus YW1]|nr:hypothetical protein U703_06045 [Rhodobacter capsulatus YW1]
MRHFLMRSLLALGLGGFLGLVALLALLPAPRAALCPGCFGLVRATDTLWVEAAMPAPDRLRLIAQIAAAKAQVARALGPTRGRLRLLACQTAACDRRLGGRGAAAVTYSFGPVAVVRLSPRGLSTTILAHELTHVALHARMGPVGQLADRLPAWADEGLAVIVSDDPRYLAPGSGLRRCRKTPRPVLPETARDWLHLAAQERDIYAEAACAMLGWMAENDGWAGVWAVIEGRRTLHLPANPLAPARAAP